jgi:hypothetical protein
MASIKTGIVSFDNADFNVNYQVHEYFDFCLEIPAGQDIFPLQIVQMGSCAHTASLSVDIRNCFLRGKTSRV